MRFNVRRWESESVPYPRFWSFSLDWPTVWTWDAWTRLRPLMGNVSTKENAVRVSKYRLVFIHKRYKYFLCLMAIKLKVDYVQKKNFWIYVGINTYFCSICLRWHHSSHKERRVQVQIAKFFSRLSGVKQKATFVLCEKWDRSINFSNFYFLTS